MIKKETIAGTDRIRVTFTMPSTAWTDRVNLVGEFNDWDTSVTPMFRTHADVHWQIAVELKAGLRYRFRYLVDGKEWLNDWHADDFFYDAASNGLCDSVVDLTQYTCPGVPVLNVEHLSAKTRVIGREDVSVKRKAENLDGHCPECNVKGSSHSTRPRRVSS